MSDKVTVQAPGVGFAGLLTLLFIGLKLGQVIDWSWWWVLSPLLISTGIGVLIFVALVVYFIFNEL